MPGTVLGILVEEPLPGEPGDELPGEPGVELDEEELDEGELELGDELELDGELGLEDELLDDGELGDGIPEGGVLWEVGGGELLLDEQPAAVITIAAINVRQRAEKFIELPPGITSEPADRASAGRGA